MFFSMYSPRKSVGTREFPFSLKVERGRQQVFAALPAGDTQCRSRRDDARTDDVAIVDGVAQRDVRIVFGAKVSHCRKTGFESAPRIPRAVQRFPRRRNLQAFV